MKILLSKTLLMMLTFTFVTSLSTAQNWMANGTNLKLNPIYGTVEIGELNGIGNFENYRVKVGSEDPDKGGIYASINHSGRAMFAVADGDGTGLRAVSTEGEAISAFSFDGTGLDAGSVRGTGLSASSIEGDALYASSTEGLGLYASSDEDDAIYAISDNGKAIHARSFQDHAGYFEGPKTYVSGNLGIGFETPLEKLHINGAIRGNEYKGGIKIQTDDGWTIMGAKNPWNSHFETSSDKFYFYQPVYVRGELYCQGMTVTSDLRLKKDVSDFRYGLKEVMRMHPVAYDYTGEGGTKSNTYNVGLFAQDLQEIAPEMVSEFVHRDTDEEGEVADEETYLQIYDTGIKYMLINAIKDQQTIIKDQQTQLDELKEMVRVLAEGEINHQEMLLEDAQGYLQQNQPNPFKGNTLIKYYVTDDVVSAVVNVYDMTGKLIHKERITQNGAGQIQLKSKNLATGTYSYSLVVDGKIADTKQMVIGQ